MSDIKLIRQLKSKDGRIVGRVDNERYPDALPQQDDLGQPIIGRIYNEKKSGAKRVRLPHPIVGRIYNEAHPDMAPSSEPAPEIIGRIENEWTDPSEK